jgi:hypothetical protein
MTYVEHTSLSIPRLILQYEFTVSEEQGCARRKRQGVKNRRQEVARNNHPSLLIVIRFNLDLSNNVSVIRSFLREKEYRLVPSELYRQVLFVRQTGFHLETQQVSGHIYSM